MAKKKTPQAPRNDFAPVEDLDICSFSSEQIVTGECISSFLFDDDSNKDVSECNNQTNATCIETNNNTINLDISPDDTKNNAPGILPSNTNATSNNKSILNDNRKTPVANGMAPPIDGEYLDTKRTYMLRASTVRKINKLKSIHPELNTYVSTIVDLAIAHYYNYIITEDGNQ